MKNNMMHKLLTLALAGVMTLSLAACGSKTDMAAAMPSRNPRAARPIRSPSSSSSTTLPLMRSQKPSPPSLTSSPLTTA